MITKLTIIKYIIIAELQVIRGCLSDVMPYRRDIPADHFEGCRPSARNPSKAVYTFNEIKELQLKEPYYNNVTYCFCEFDHWCNSAMGQMLFIQQQQLFFLLPIIIIINIIVGLIYSKMS